MLFSCGTGKTDWRRFARQGQGMRDRRRHGPALHVHASTNAAERACRGIALPCRLRYKDRDHQAENHEALAGMLAGRGEPAESTDLPGC
jgi:hypothetical protein